MNIETRGRFKNLCKNEAKFAAIFFAQYLMGTKMAKSIDLELIFENMTDVADGYCHPHECGRNPRMFEVSVNSNLQRHKQLQVLAHEMVHVKQYAKNELKSDDASSASFAGKDYKITSSIEDYLNYPWEIEAFGREDCTCCIPLS